MEPRLSLVTLGVADLERATRFYESVLGLPRIPTPPEVAMFRLGATWLSLFPREALAADAGVPAAGGGFPGFARAYLHHLFAANEILSAILVSIHNVRFYERLVQGARAAILAGDYESWRREFLAAYGGNDEPDPETRHSPAGSIGNSGFQATSHKKPSGSAK